MLIKCFLWKKIEEKRTIWVDSQLIKYIGNKKTQFSNAKKKIQYELLIENLSPKICTQLEP